MKKRILAGALAALFVFAGVAAGCGGKGGSDPEGKEPDGSTEPLPGEGEEGERTLRELDPDFRYAYQVSDYKVSYEGVTIFGKMYRPKADGKFPAVILSHGFNGNYGGFTRECERFAERGYIAYAFDFCGAQANGQSTGRTAAEYTPMTMKRDLCEVIAKIKNHYRVDGTQVFLFGGSQGGFITSLAAAEEDIKDEIAGIAMYFPAYNIPDDRRNEYPTADDIPADDQLIPMMGYYINGAFVRSVYELDPYAVIGNYKKDVCIVWGDADELVKREYIDRAVETYGAERVSLKVIPGAGHGFAGAVQTTAIETVLSFLEARTYETK